MTLLRLFFRLSICLGMIGQIGTQAQEPATPGSSHVYSGGKLAGTLGSPSSVPQFPTLPGSNQGPAIPAPLLNNTEAAIDQESHGDFPSMSRSPSLPLGTLQRSWDRPMPANGQTAPGVVHYLWQSDFVMGVRTRDFMVTTLMLPGWERISEYYVGDPVVFEIKKVKTNIVAIRSRNAGADSNLVLLGASGNIYNFYIRSEAWNSSQVTDLAVYVDAVKDGADQDGGAVGDDLSQPASSPVMPDYIRKIVKRPEDVRFDMRLFAQHPGDADIAPSRVFEDGLFTYFDFGDRADTVTRPVVHQVVDGVDSVVNSRTAGPHGSILIAEGIGDFTLRSGNRVVCVKRVGPKSIDGVGG
jgi:type IV secretory pathway VirB9-like protein